MFSLILLKLTATESLRLERAFLIRERKSEIGSCILILYLPLLPARFNQSWDKTIHT